MDARAGEGRTSPSRRAGADAPVEVLRRWEDSGATWRVVSGTASRVTIALLRCDGGEEVDRLTSDDPELLAWVRARYPGER